MNNIKIIKGCVILLLFSVIAITSCTEDEDNFCEVTVVSGEGGTAIIYPNNPTNKIVAGWWVELIAKSEKNYRFVNWTVNGKEVSRDNPYKATINTSTQFKANFEKDNFTVKVLSSEGGTAKASQEGEVLNGTQVAFTATANEGYSFVNWTVNGNEVSKYNKYVKTIIEDIEIKANFKELHKVSVIASEGGIANASQTGEVLNGTEVTFTARPSEGYSFVNWTVNGEEVSKEATYTITVTKDVEYVANFVTHKITVVAGEGGTAKASKSQVGHNAQVTLTATPNEGYSFVNWTANGEEVSTENPYTATITADTEFKASFIEKYNGHEYVDLGLPSGIKWATCNVGADTPEEYGDYFAWGETESKTTYNWSTYKYCNGDRYSMTKYCVDSGYGTLDNKTTLELSDDAARVNWGGSWRMPTIAEQYELSNTSNCVWTWTTQNGVIGYKVTSKKNGNSIFLPAAGYLYGSVLKYAGDDGYYWSSSLYTNYSYDAFGLSFFSSGVGRYGYYRYDGQSVRAVCE